MRAFVSNRNHIDGKQFGHCWPANNVQICSQIKTLHWTFSMNLMKSISNIKSRLSTCLKAYKEILKFLSEDSKILSSLENDQSLL